MSGINIAASGKVFDMVVIMVRSSGVEVVTGSDALLLMPRLMTIFLGLGLTGDINFFRMSVRFLKFIPG